MVAYAAHMAALMGANVIKVKPPSADLDLDAAKKVYQAEDIDSSTLAARVRHVMQCAFAGKRLVVFSGGEAKDTEGLLDEIRQIATAAARARSSGATASAGRSTRPSPCSTR